MIAQSAITATRESDDIPHIEDTPALFWVTRHGKPVKRAWNELSATEQRQSREAAERAAYVTMFSIYN
jgi:hypothetical protein